MRITFLRTEPRDNALGLLGSAHPFIPPRLIQTGAGLPRRRLCKRNVVWYNTAISDQPPAISRDTAPDPDHALMRRVAQGDEAALSVLIGRYKSPVHSFVFRMLGDAEEADDVAQELFIKVYRTADLYEPRAKFTTWLFTIANNLATDRLRKRQRRPTVSGDEAEARLRASPDSGDDPSQAAGREEQAAAVQRAIAQLPSDQKTALILYEYDDLSYAEIADVMRCSTKSVEARLHRAKESLRKRLARWL